MITKYELFADGQMVREFGALDAAKREAALIRQPWKIWEVAATGPSLTAYRTARVILEGTGEWTRTHTIEIVSAFGARTRLCVMLTPLGFFTEPAWNRGDTADFKYTGINNRELVRRDGRAIGHHTITKEN